MRRIIVSMNITVDGFMAGPYGELDWQVNNWTSEMARLLGEQLSRADTILLGRNTYAAMAAYWPAAGCSFNLSRDDIAYATLMNDYPKIVCSTTLKNARWHNSRIIKTDICAAITNLKKQPGKDIIIYGSRTLVQYLSQQKLIDEYLLWVYPITLGKGISLFTKAEPLKLLDMKQFSSGGVVVLNYGYTDK
jgi:dihydrofolate reductase